MSSESFSISFLRGNPMTGWAVWITGLPGSGKSTIVRSLAKKLRKRNIEFQILSVDILRKVLTPNPKYNEEERKIVYNTLIFIAHLLTSHSVNVLIDATGNRRFYRNNARQQIKKFIEAYVHCPLNICKLREKKRRITSEAPRGIYDKAEKKKSLTVPGVGVPYERPLKPEVTVDSLRLNPNKSAEKILSILMRRFYKKGIVEV